MKNLRKLLASLINDPFSTHQLPKVALLMLLFGAVNTVSGIGGYVLDGPFWFQAWIGIPFLAVGAALTLRVVLARRHRPVVE